MTIAIRPVELESLLVSDVQIAASHDNIDGARLSATAFLTTFSEYKADRYMRFSSCCVIGRQSCFSITTTEIYRICIFLRGITADVSARF